MKIVLLGAPGCGKGTQASLIKNRYGIPHISTGEIFRENIKNNTEIGVKIKKIIDSGNLAPDELTIQIVKDRLSENDCKEGYLLDGFPRNITQAKALEDYSAPDMVLDIDIPLEKLQKRLSGRRSCAKCGESFHTDFIGDVKVCPECGGELFIRKDDRIESVKERLKVYKEQTFSLVEFYAKLNKLVKIDGDATIEQVFDNVKKVLG